MKSKKELQDLIEAQIEGVITPDEHASLNKLLKEDPEARKIYINDMKLHSMLKWELRSVEKEDELPSEEFSKKPLSFQRWQIALLSAAAAVLFSFVFFQKTTSQRQAGTDGQEQNSSPLLVARITSSQNVGGLETANNAQLGEWLPIGPIKLDQGMLEVTFDSGAKVVLEGPAEFHLESHNRGFLTSGKLVADVPKQATGFIVNTPTGNIVDIGTSFGVNVDRQGDTEVHVLEGLIEVTSIDENIKPNQPLRESEAMKMVALGPKPLENIPFSADEFIAATEVKEFKPQYNHVHFPMDENKSRIVRDLGKGFPNSPYKGKHRVNEVVTDANWISGPFGSALKFEGDSSYIRTGFKGIEGDKPRTIAFWVKIPPQATREDAYAILSWGKKREEGKKWVVLWNTKSGAGNVGALRVSYEGGHFIGTTDLRDGLWHHVAIVYIGGKGSNVASHVRLYVDGAFDGISGSKTALSIDTKTSGADVINMNIARYMDKQLFFRGSLDELYIFDVALTPADIMKLKNENKVPEKNN